MGLKVVEDVPINGKPFEPKVHIIFNSGIKNVEYLTELKLVGNRPS